MNRRVNALIKKLAAVFLLLPSVALCEVSILYSETPQNVEFVGPAVSAAAIGLQKPALDKNTSLRFTAFSQQFDIALTDNSTLLSPEQRERMPLDLNIYRGSINGVEGSWTRLVVSGDEIRGLLFDGREMYAVEVDAMQQPVIFRLNDLLIESGTLSCSNAANIKTGSGLLNAVSKELATSVANGPGATEQIDLAVVGDFEFSSDKGASAEADMVARINNVDGIFSAQLGVQLNINQIDVFTDSNDPFTDELNASNLIDELSDFRNARANQFANGLTHLFTGRNLEGSTVGIAYTGALCSRRFGAGLTQGTHSLTVDSLIAAHELGHNFGAPHDGTSGSACEAEAQTFLMAPSVNGSDEFSACSISQMQQEVAGSSCVTALPSTDVAVVAGSAPATLLGDPTTVTFNVDSIGTDNASNVEVNLSIPANVTLNSVTPTAGSCSTGAGSASCSLGSIAAGASESISITVEASDVGSVSIDATVTAGSDSNNNNNQSTAQFNVDPAVDLVATAVAVQATLNQSTTVRPSVENRSSIAATNVSVVITPDANIDLTAASWALGSCTIDSGVATCVAASVGAGATSTLDVSITGTAEGSISYSVSVAADETDRDTANNDSSANVTVGPVVTAPPPPPTSNDDSGGGAVNVWLILALATVALRSRRRSVRPVT